MRNLAELLAGAARGKGGKAFLLHPESGGRYSYRAMNRLADKAAGLLRGRGVRRGDRVMLGLPNVPEFFHFLFGAAKLGAIAVPVDPRSKGSEWEAMLGHCRAKAVVCGRQARERLPRGAPLLDAVALKDAAPWGAGPLRAGSPHDPCLILYTSGTSGRPKGAVHSHSSILAKVREISRRFRWDEDTRSLCLLPVCFGHALIANCLTALQYRGSLVLAPVFGIDNLGGLWETMRRLKVDTFSCVPTVLRVLLQLGDRLGKPPKCRFATCASATLPEALAAGFERAFGIPVLNCYGLTETASWIASEIPGEKARASGSVGKPIGCEIRILDECRRPLGAGASGQIAVRGPSVFAGYYRRPRRGSAWFFTGDIGWKDERGRLFLQGRGKNVINRNGIKVHPEEIDAVLARHPAVLESATLGLPDPYLGEKIVSFVAFKPGATSDPAGLIAHCRESLADYKCPERVELVARLPRDARGKLRLAELLRR